MNSGIDGFSRSRHVFTTVMKLACATFLFTGIAFSERLPVRTYTVADGLLRDSVSRIRKDSRGFLWFCTVEGISRFDGEGFSNFRVEDGLPDRHVNDILETSSGVYLIATDKGLARLNPKGEPGSLDNPLFTVFHPEGQKAQQIGTLFQDHGGRIWAGTPDGLYRVTENNNEFGFELFPVPNFEAVAIMEDRNGIVWAGGESGTAGMLVKIWQDEHFKTYSAPEGLPKSQLDALLETSDGHILAGLRPGQREIGLLQISASTDEGGSVVERMWRTEDGLPSFWVSSLYQGTDGKLWVGTTEGLCLWQGDGNNTSVCRTYAASNGLCDREVASFAEDVDGNLWIATGCGVKRIARYGFTIYGEGDNLYTPYVGSILETPSGQLIVNNRKDRYALSMFDGSQFHTRLLHIPEKVYLGWGWKQLALQDVEGLWWIPTGDGLFRTRERTSFEKLGTATLERVETRGSSLQVFRLFQDSAGDIWLATVGNGAGKLLRWSRKSNEWEDLTEKAGFSPNTIGTVFIEDKRGDLWIATGSDGDDGRLVRYSDGIFRTFTENEGAPKGWTRDAYVDDAGRLWLANTASGLLRLDDVSSEELKFTRYAFAEGLSSTAVYCVTGDALGRIYVGTGRGIDRLRPETRIVEHFTVAEGLPASDVELAYRDRNDTLWFGTPNGLVHFQPEPDKQRTPPKVLITHLQTGVHPLPVSLLGESQIDDLRFEPDENQVRAEFIGLGSALGEKLRYEYRLNGSSEWQPVSERTVNFANLAPGNYRFEVRAVSIDKLYSSPASVSFTIAAPFWKRWWFVLLVSLGIAGAVYVIYKNRFRRLIELERMRTRIATDLHDDIGANLTRISILSEVARQKAANGNGQMLASIADIARESVASMNDIVWAVSPKHDSLGDLVTRMRRHAEEVFALRNIELDFDAPVADAGLRLGVGVRRDLLLIFKEAVNNAARHSGCTRVHVGMSLNTMELYLRVSDNGRAFEIGTSDNEGIGIDSMKRRAHGVRADLLIESVQGTGTTVSLKLPLSRVD